MATQRVPAGKNFTLKGSTWLGYGQVADQAKLAVPPLVVGTDIDARLYVDTIAWPNRSVLTWECPEVATQSTKPWGYIHLANSRYRFAVPQVIVPPKMLKDISTLELALKARMAIFSGDASVLSDTFFHPTADPLSTPLLELGVFPYASEAAVKFFKQATPIRGGTFYDRAGTPWLAGVKGVYAMFIPALSTARLTPGESYDGMLDLKGMTDFLLGAGLLSPFAWYTGTALGVEPQSGGGALYVDEAQVTYA